MQGVLYIIIALCSMIVGVIIGYIYRGSKKQATDGKLRRFVDPDDGPYLFLELKPESEPMTLMNKKYAIFEVDQSDIVSHN